jgi:hypothetical protein
VRVMFLLGFALHFLLNDKENASFQTLKLSPSPALGVSNKR